MVNHYVKKGLRKLKSLSILITLLFFTIATLVPSYVHATENPPKTNGVQMSFSGADTTYQSSNISLSVKIQSDKQIDSTSVKMKLDGQLLSSSFSYKGHWEDYDTYWVLESDLEGTVSANAKNLKDGSHTLSISATDITGVPVTKDWNFNISEKPNFSNPTPSNGKDTNKNIGFSIKVSDNDGIDESSINMLFDGNLVSTTYSNSTGIISYSPVSGMSDGPHNVKITLKDIKGTSSAYESNFTVCTSGPSLTFLKAGQTLTSKQNLSIDIQSIIDLSDTGYTVKLNGQPINASFSYPESRWDEDEYDWIVENYKVGRLTINSPNLQNGIQTLEVTAKDHLGTSTTQSWSFTVNIKPEMGTPIPGENSFTKDNTGFSLKITNNAPINSNSIIATLDGETVPVNYSSTTGILTYSAAKPISDGLHNVSVAVEDSTGNKSSYSWKYNILTTGPNIDFVQKDQVIDSIPKLMVNLNSGADLTNSGFTFKIDGQQVNAQFQFKGHWESEDEWADPEWFVDSNKEGTLSFAPSNLSDGLHTVEVTAKDSLGNTTTKKWNFTILMKPEFSNASPINGSQVLTNKGFSVKVVDYNDGIKDSSSFAVKLNGKLVQAEYNQTTKILTYNPETNLPDGDYTVNIVATDKAGTQSEYAWTFKVKSIGPAITFVENGKTFTTLPTLTFLLQSNADISQTGFSLKVDGIVIDPANYTVTFPGHWESTYDEYNDEDINYYVRDSFKEATVSYRPSSLFSGNHTIKLSAKDVSGNNTTIEGSFTNVGTQSLEITAPANNAVIKSVTAITATTNLSKVNVSIKKFGTNVVTNLGDRSSAYGTWNWDTTTISDGEYIITLTGYDALGNSVKTEKNVRVANIQQGMGLSYWGITGNHWGKVNIANGNFVVGQSDIQLPGKGMGTEFSRVYNSQLKTNGVLGWGWRINVPELAEQSDKSVVITSGDGAKFTYTLNTDGSYKMPTGQYAILIRNAENNFELKYKDGSKYIFDSTNNKIILKDKNGNSVIYQYDNSQKLISITEPSGRVTSLTYNTKGKLSSVKDYSSRTWTYAYDSNQNLIQVTDPLYKNLIFSYDGNHQLISITDANGKKTTYNYLSGKLSGMTDPLNNTTSYSYDAAASNFVETDPKGNKTTSVYDINWNVTTLTNAENGVVKTTYDENYNVIKKADALNRKTTYTYDSMGNVLSETDAMNNTITYVYDQNSNLLSKTDAMGKTTTYSYDSKGNLVTDGVTVNTYNSDGTVSKVIDAKGNESTYTYDNFGNVIKVTDALGKATSFTYNSLGLKLSETDAVGNKTTYSYDSLGRMLVVTVPDGNNPPKSTTYTYDSNGNRLTARDPVGNVSTWTYDGLNKVLSLSEPGNKVKNNSYDANGNLISETSQDGKVTQYSYDAMNRLVNVKKADGSTVTYSYDKENNKIKMVDSIGPTVNYEYNDSNLLTKESSSTGKVITYTYDKNYQLIGKTVNGVSAGLSQTYNYQGSNLDNIVANGTTTNFTYDANSNRTGILYANKSSVNYAYDELDRVTSVINKGVSGNPLSNFSYAYYDNGQIKSVTDIQGVTTYEYDNQNRLTKIIGATSKITDYTYDDLGNRATESITVNGVTSTTSYTYDLTLNQLKTITKPDGSTIKYTYDVNGSTLSKTDNTGVTSYEYNSNNQLTKVVKPNGDVIVYTYDGNNKRISKTVNGTLSKYVYDGEQLIEEIDGSGNVQASYVYDDKGSPISVTKGGETYNYQYNGHGDVVALTDSKGNVVSTYEYDVWGNVTAKSGSIDSHFGYAGQFGYVYDKETGLYFLQSRYYDPEIGRFTTRDRFKGFEDRPASQNQYTYCENDPVMNVDPTGMFTVKQVDQVINFLTWASGVFGAISLVSLWINPWLCAQAGSVSYWLGWAGYMVYGYKAYKTHMKMGDFLVGSTLTLITQFTGTLALPVKSLFNASKVETVCYFITRFLTNLQVAKSL